MICAPLWTMHALLNTLLGLRILRGAFMRLVTFETPAKQSRIGAMTTDDRVVDLHSACALYLRDVENESAFYRLAEALVPPEMRALFEGGDTSLEAAHKAFDYVLQQDFGAPGPGGETIFYAADEITLKAPIIPRKFFHTAGNFREHHEEATKAGFSHPVMPWIVFFQNVDAIIGHDEPVIYPEHLTQELDYELELAVVLKKGGKHFSPEEAKDYVGGYVIFNDITARDIQRRSQSLVSEGWRCDGMRDRKDWHPAKSRDFVGRSLRAQGCSDGYAGSAEITCRSRNDSYCFLCASVTP